MNEKILKIGIRKFNSLAKKYDGFINVVIDNWRGYRFVYDTEDVRKCQNDCQNCNLFKVLKNEKGGLFSAGLYLATEADKKIFGPQNYLNCKTLEQYQNCYLNFLKKLKTKAEIEAELELVRKLTLVYCQKGSLEKEENVFKKAILNFYEK